MLLPELLLSLPVTSISILWAESFLLHNDPFSLPPQPLPQIWFLHPLHLVSFIIFLRFSLPLYFPLFLMVFFFLNPNVITFFSAVSLTKFFLGPKCSNHCVLHNFYKKNSNFCCDIISWRLVCSSLFPLQLLFIVNCILNLISQPTLFFFALPWLLLILFFIFPLHQFPFTRSLLKGLNFLPQFLFSFSHSFCFAFHVGRERKKKKEKDTKHVQPHRTFKKKIFFYLFSLGEGRWTTNLSIDARCLPSWESNPHQIKLSD